MQKLKLNYFPSGNINIVNMIEQKNSEFNSFKTKELRSAIITNELDPSLKDEIHESLIWRKLWGKMAKFFFTLTFILMGTTSLLSFASNTIVKSDISYYAGMIGTIGMLSDRFAHYCSSQSSISTSRLNQLLKIVGINDTIPTIPIATNTEDHATALTGNNKPNVSHV